METVILFHTCTGCRSLYGTMARSRRNECPTCGHVDVIIMTSGPVLAIDKLAPQRSGSW